MRGLLKIDQEIQKFIFKIDSFFWPVNGKSPIINEIIKFLCAFLSPLYLIAYVLIFTPAFPSNSFDQGIVAVCLFQGFLIPIAFVPGGGLIWMAFRDPKYANLEFLKYAAENTFIFSSMIGMVSTTVLGFLIYNSLPLINLNVFLNLLAFFILYVMYLIVAISRETKKIEKFYVKNYRFTYFYDTLFLILLLYYFMPKLIM